MKIIGIIINLLGIVFIIAFFISYLSSSQALVEHLNTTASRGGNDGPTAIFYTMKVNRYFIAMLLCSIGAFVFNLVVFIKNKIG